MRLLFFALFLVTHTAFSQAPFFWHYSEADGLPSNLVYSAMQDSKGYVWFATDKGVSCYNGTTFRNYSTSDGLSDNEVFQIKEDALGRIWFLTYSGIPSYYSNGKFYNPTNSSALAESPVSGFLRSFTEGLNGNVFLATNHGSVYQITPDDRVIIIRREAAGSHLVRYLWFNKNQLFGALDNLAVLNLSTGQRIDLKPDSLNDHAQRYLYSKARLYMSQRNSLDIFSNEFKTQKSITLPPGEIIQDISPGFEESNLSICTKKGLRFFEIGSNTLSEPHLPNHNISSTFLDNQGGLWITTLDDGVFYAPYSGMEHFEVKKHGQSLPVHSLFRMNDTLFYGANDYCFGALVNDSMKNYQLVVGQHKGQGRIMDFFDLNGMVAVRGEKIIHWGRSFSGPLKAISYPGISAYPNNDNSFWMSDLFGFRLLSSQLPDGNNPLRSFEVGNRVFSMVQMSDSAMLVGTSDGVLRVSLQNGVVTSSFPETQLKRVSAMMPLGQNRILVTTSGWGAFLYENDALLAHFDQNSGLVSSDIARIRLDSNDGLWLCTAKGISYVKHMSAPPSHWRWQNINSDNGLPIDNVEDVAILNDRLFIASSIGIISMDIPNFLSPKVPPGLVVNGIEHSSQRLSFSNEVIEVPAEWKSFTIDFEAISYPAKKLTYSFRIDGQGWQVTHAEDLSLANLQPGTHRIELRVKSELSEWSKPAEIMLEVPTGFWQTWWVQLLGVVAMLALLYALFRLKIILVDRKLIYSYVRDLIDKAAERNTITVKVGSETRKVQIRHLLWIKSEANYCSIITTKEKLFVLGSLKSFEDLLKDEKDFLRIHRGYIVNLKKITGTKRNQITIADTPIPIGATYIQGFRNAYPDYKDMH